MVNRADRGGQPKVFGRVKGDGRVKYYRLRANMRATQKLFRASRRVYAAGNFSVLGT